MADSKTNPMESSIILCQHCRARNLDAIVDLELAPEQLPLEIWNQTRPYTWSVDWWQTVNAAATCALCRILYATNERGMVAVQPKIGAHSAQTLFDSNQVKDVVIWEIHSRRTTLLLPYYEGRGTREQTHQITGRIIDPNRIDYKLLRHW